MTKYSTKLLAAALLASLAAFTGSAHADGYKVVVKAPVNQGTFHLGTHLDVADGNNAFAKSRIGSISNTGNIDAEVNQLTAVTGTTGAIALGDNARATLAIGALNEVTIKDSVTQTTVANNAFAIAGTNAEACTGIGIIGELPDCTQ